LSPVSPFSEIRESTACLCIVSPSRRNIDFSCIQQVLLTVTAWQLRSDVYRFFHIRNIHHALGLRHWATWTAVNSICVPCAHQLHLQVEHCRVQRTRHGG
jgi:hypothetical protein